jgi:uncharacterized protein
MRFAGYAAIFDFPDKGGDIVLKGAFRHLPHDPVPIFCQHDPARRIGVAESLAEDSRGLRVIARLNSGQTASKGQGLSFGYRVKAARDRTYRELTDLELIEISLVTHPMQPLARVIAIECEEGD